MDREALAYHRHIRKVAKEAKAMSDPEIERSFETVAAVERLRKERDEALRQQDGLAQALRDVQKERDEERKLIQRAYDAIYDLGCGLADEGHSWTAVERKAWETAERALRKAIDLT